MSLTGRPFLRRGPSGPLAPKLGLIQCGYDQPEKTQPLPPSGPASVIPRDVALAPLQVQLPDVEPGNILEVDFNVHVQNDSLGITVGIAILPMVSFDGTTVLAPASSFFVMQNGQSVASVEDDTYRALRGLIGVVIPDGATIATVQLFFSASDPGLGIYGTDLPFIGSAGSTLKVSEISGLSVPQPGPSVLLPF